MPPGRHISNNTIPPGLLVVDNFLDPAWRRSLLHECENKAGSAHAIGAEAGGEGKRIAVDNDVRKSEHIDIGSVKTDVIGAVRQIFTNVVGPHFQRRIEWFEKPEILRYREGGQYIPHADSENWIEKDQRWKRAINRDLSVLLYLNDDFEGGEVHFPNFGYTIKPTTGLLIAFPSDHRYLHAAQTVTAGVRYAVVSWAAVFGGPRAEGALSPQIIKV